MFADRHGGDDRTIYVRRVYVMNNIVHTSSMTDICTANSNKGGPDIISDGLGGAIISWRDHRNDNWYEIYAQRIDASGNNLWNADGMPIPSQNMVPNGEGGAIIIVSALPLNARGIDKAGYIVWATYDGWPDNVQQWVNSALPVSDGAGGAIFPWIQTLDYDHYEIYAQRLDNSGNIQWNTGVLCGLSAGITSELRIISDGSGGAIIAWTEQNSATKLYAQRVDTSGKTLWTSNGVSIKTISDYLLDFQIISDGSGGAILAWEQEHEIYTQRVDTSGNILWKPEGIAACTTDTYQREPRLVSDGSDGVIIVWEDYRSGRNIYAQRVDDSGNILWDSEGVYISHFRGDLLNLQIVSNGSGGAIILGEEGERYPDLPDIFVEIVDSNGQVAQSENTVYPGPHLRTLKPEPRNTYPNKPMQHSQGPEPPNRLIDTSVLIIVIVAAIAVAFVIFLTVRLLARKRNN